MKLLLLLLSVVSLASCSAGRPDAFVFYVEIRPDQATQFVRAITAVANDDDLETAVSRLTSDAGNVLNVFEGRGRGLELWAQNTPLSGSEDQKLCGIHSEAYPDPAQFTVSTVPGFFGSRAAAKELGERVLSQLHKLGFDVRLEPAICGQDAMRARS